MDICGMCKNFSSMEHSCRKCLCSLSDLRNVEQYSDIHADNHLHRNDQMMQQNYLEKVDRHVLHINGIKNQSLYFEFPFFESSTMLPQCSSHDFLGIVHK